MLNKKYISAILKSRPADSHKGVFGHALLAAGSKGMAGAAVLAARACLRSGAGLVTVHSAACNRTVLQTLAPEAMFCSDVENDWISEVYINKKYDSAAIGAGIGKNEKTVSALKNFFAKIDFPCVVDADALNIIAENKNLLDKIPKNSILTPHYKEFERLFGKTVSREEQIKIATENALKYRLNIILKGHKTVIINSEGEMMENTTGNSGMASGGAGDALTGLLAGLLAQHYQPPHAAQLGVYIHGLAADLALDKQSEESLIASDIIENFGKAFCFIRQEINLPLLAQTN
ncbi:MAG: NAD(P)H-hydrate dehydratase [Paludibacter sp.]|nr:NAD(P)H-hydrate dehydratase [Paludibacter sp.]